MFCTSYRPGYSLPWLAGAGGRKQASVGIKHASGHFLLRSNHWGAIGSWVPGQFLNAYASAQLSSALQPSPAPRSTPAAVATCSRCRQVVATCSRLPTSSSTDHKKSSRFTALAASAVVLSMQVVPLLPTHTYCVGMNPRVSRAFLQSPCNPGSTGI